MEKGFDYSITYLHLYKVKEITLKNEKGRKEDYITAFEEIFRTQFCYKCEKIPKLSIIFVQRDNKSNV